MSYAVNCDALEVGRGETFIVLNVPVEAGGLALVEVEGHQIPGRLDGNTLSLPDVAIELAGDASYRVLGAVVPVDFNRVCLN